MPFLDIKTNENFEFTDLDRRNIWMGDGIEKKDSDAIYHRFYGTLSNGNNLPSLMQWKQWWQPKETYQTPAVLCKSLALEWPNFAEDVKTLTACCLIKLGDYYHVADCLSKFWQANERHLLPMILIDNLEDLLNKDYRPDIPEYINSITNQGNGSYELMRHIIYEYGLESTLEIHFPDYIEIFLGKLILWKYIDVSSELNSIDDSSSTEIEKIFPQHIEK